MTDPTFDTVFAKINRKYGDHAIMWLNDASHLSIEAIPTGSLALDLALGVGGIPRGRIIEIFGPESCLDENTFIQYAVRESDGERQNTKGGTIRRLYERFHRLAISGQGNYQRPQTKDSIFTAPCMNEDGRIFHNRIVDVVYTGEKECFTVKTASGLEITATAEHKFFTGDRFVPLSELSVGDEIATHQNVPFTVAYPRMRVNRKHLFLKNHPMAGVKNIFDKKTGNTYTYHRICNSRAVVEASANGLSMPEYIQRLNTGDVAGMCFLDRNDHVHHKDEDVTNDDLGNLVVISASEHGKLHSMERHNNMRFTIVPDTIVSISHAGTRETYDIRMESPFNNYVAAGFVVHNSGKTTICQHIIAEAQKMGLGCAFIDMEHAMDPAYAEICGVDLSKLSITQPTTGEEALETASILINSKLFGIVVVDSVAALVPQAELDGEMGDQQMGLHARLMSKAMRKLSGAVRESNTALLFTNQLRMKIGVSFGNPETTTGGNALKFYASVRMDIRSPQSGMIKDEGEGMGKRVKVTIKKNKVAIPYRTAEFDIMFGEGISKTGDVLDMAVATEVVTKRGAFFSYGDTRLGQGRENSKQYLKEHPERLDELYRLVCEKAKGGPVVTVPVEEAGESEPELA